VRDGDNVAKLTAQISRADQLMKGNMSDHVIYLCECTVIVQNLHMINKATISYTDSYLGIYRNNKLNSLAELYECEMTFVMFRLYVPILNRYFHWFFHTQFTDPNSILLWRYEDPELGPRKMPAFSSPIQGVVRIEENAVFCVDVENKNIELAVNGTRYPIGSQIIYIVE
jgi:hypothetical protein